MAKTTKIADRAWLRWALMVPWAFCWAFFITFPLHWVLMLWLSAACNSDRILTLSPENVDAVERFLLPGFVSYGFVVGGGRMAPRWNFYVGIAHAVVFACIASFLMGSVGFDLRTCLLWVIGIGVGLGRIWLMQSEWKAAVPIAEVEEAE